MDAGGTWTVADLFERSPLQFGSRGDSYLWHVMRTEFAGTPLPSSWFELREMLFTAVECAIHQPLNAEAESPSVYVAEFDPGHGMSAGMVHMPWWVDTGIPILLDRFEAARGEAPD
jgi:hypothetical protein